MGAVRSSERRGLRTILREGASICDCLNLYGMVTECDGEGNGGPYRPSDRNTAKNATGFGRAPIEIFSDSCVMINLRS